MPKKIGCISQNFEKKRLRATAARARQVCRPSRRCYLATFLDIRYLMICLCCSSEYLHLEKHCNSKFEIEHSYDNLKMS